MGMAGLLCCLQSSEAAAGGAPRTSGASAAGPGWAAGGPQDQGQGLGAAVLLIWATTSGAEAITPAELCGRAGLTSPADLLKREKELEALWVVGAVRKVPALDRHTVTERLQ